MDRRAIAGAAFRKISLLAALLISEPALATSTTPASGSIINGYAKVLSLSADTAAVNSTSGFAVGDTVLLVQMQGATAARNDNAVHGDISAYGTAGRFVYGKIASISGNSITFESALGVALDTAGSVQIVKVAFYDGANLTTAITAKAWDGNSGGVIAIDDKANLTISANIDATGKGFRGGALAVTTPFDNCASDQRNYTGSIQNGTGNKGEGVAVTTSSHTSRRGHNGNGGGGGNITDAGGGGGGNVGAGGIGGREIDICDDDGHFGGIGGQALSYAPNNRLFMGGGGGSGSEVSQAATGGSRSGGGMIFIRARNIAFNAGTIRANGLSAVQDDANGSDGGGAGGVVAISVVSSISGSANIEVRGGDGGDESNIQFAHGTGGSGGGGAIRLNGAICSSVTTLVGAGRAGISQLGSNSGDANWGASPGNPGNCLGNFAALGTVPQPKPANLNVYKSSSVFTAGTSNPGFRLPDEDIIYSIRIENIGESAAGAESVFIVDQLPANLTFFNADIDSGGPDTYPGNTPVAFADNGSGLSFSYPRDVAYSNASAIPASFTECGYVPVSGYDPNVRYICINPKGSFAPPAPVSSFTLNLRTRIK